MKMYAIKKGNEFFCAYLREVTKAAPFYPLSCGHVTLYGTKREAILELNSYSIAAQRNMRIVPIEIKVAK